MRRWCGEGAGVIRMTQYATITAHLLKLNSSACVMSSRVRKNPFLHEKSFRTLRSNWLPSFSSPPLGEITERESRLRKAFFRSLLGLGACNSARECAARIYSREFSPEICGRVNIRQRVDTVGSMRRGRCYRLVVGLLAHKHILRRSRTKCLGAQAGDADADSFAIPAAAERHQHRDPHNRKAGGGLAMLQVGEPRIHRNRREAYLTEDLAGLCRGRHQVSEEIFGLDRSCASLAFECNVAFECENRGGVISGRIRMREAAANRAAIAHLDIADRGSALRQQAEFAFNDFR